MAKKRRRTKKVAQPACNAVNAQHGIYSAGRQHETRVEIPPAEPDLETLRSVTREWLVPSLVEKFLRLHGVQPRSSPRTLVTGTKPTMSTFSRGNLLM